MRLEKVIRSEVTMQIALDGPPPAPCRYGARSLGQIRCPLWNQKMDA